MTSEMQRRRIILLGASNLTMALPTLLATAQAMGEGACRFMTALGHGRSFGTRSTVLLRTLPAILDCGLWEQLHRDESLRGPP
ncbi:hypothetical protein ACERK3_08020 [Phycisphaerales bacterium AB-hyl4]|uniref:Uncharacterized protein n=1 Tax=Natronomicrosphaera hydrolytica TaxID=3242702 RepID=A0ABV4U661_9BACT